ncbi:oleoyl-acyl carrier protein thioesterase 1 [Carex littledalei]|uniref:Acyl-[acyl-carrier-protein] hydrolase n=1 Tax=Carex littledalei TaxID=544730 RepID=A0A833RB73_9POAL|nr:oleoyl-acyl carrier protein thioesterase 1 [Carex littledalei]
MFSIHVAAPPFSSASVQYRRLHNLCREQRGVKCTIGHDMGRSTNSVPSLENEKVTDKGSGTVAREALGEKVTFGASEMDDLVYKERFVIRGSEVGVNNTATIEAIASLLQETSGNRARRFGWSKDVNPTPPVMRKHRLVWITFRVHIRMYKYPARGDVVEIEHWSEPDGRIGAMLNFIIRNISTGEVIGRSTSKLVFMNLDTRKVQKISSDVSDEYLSICTKSPRLAFPEKNNQSLWKIPKLDEPADYSQLGLKPRIADIDVNKHVNNVTYYSWLLQSIPQDIVETHELEAITIHYRRECKFSDTIDSLATTELEVESVNPFEDKSTLSNLNLNSEGRHQFLHSLKFSYTGQEINRGRTIWRKIDK